METDRQLEVRALTLAGIRWMVNRAGFYATGMGELEFLKNFALEIRVSEKFCL